MASEKAKNKLVRTAGNLMLTIEIKCPQCSGHVPIANARVTLNLETLNCIFCKHKFDFSKKHVKLLTDAFKRTREYFEIEKMKLTER